MSARRAGGAGGAGWLTAKRRPVFPLRGAPVSTRLKLPAPPIATGGRVWVGYSGGVDSTTLLHLLARSGLADLRAVHVHHGLQPAAEGWVRHCRRVCRDLGVPLRVLRVAVAPAGEGLEAAARAARYAAMSRLLRPGDVLAVAHQRDDQAETVLFRALRGTGIAGLGAMRARESLGAAVLWRPLLGYPRSRLLRYAQTEGLRWIDDPHNEDPALARSFLRQAVLPQLQRHFPAAGESLARLARHAQASERLLADLAQVDATALEDRGGLDIGGLLQLDPERRRNLLYHRWRELGLQPPGEEWYARLEREVLGSRADAEPMLVHGGGEARRYRGRLYLMNALPPPPHGQRLDWPRGRRKLELPSGCGILRCSVAPPSDLIVRFGVHGERLRLDRAAHRRSLKNLCQEAGLPPWLRERMPLIELELERGAELLAVGGRWRSPRAAELGLDFVWNHSIPGAPN